MNVCVCVRASVSVCVCMCVCVSVCSRRPSGQEGDASVFVCV